MTVLAPDADRLAHLVRVGQKLLDGGSAHEAEHALDCAYDVHTETVALLRALEEVCRVTRPGSHEFKDAAYHLRLAGKLVLTGLNARRNHADMERVKAHSLAIDIAAMNEGFAIAERRLAEARRDAA
jgi:hypothetical protein